MRLFIAEKPSVGMDIAKALGGTAVRGEGFVQVGDDVVTWCIGHLIGQAKPEAYGEQYARWDVAHLPIVPTTWKMEPNPKTRAQLNAVGALLRKANMVVNCGDSAREGQMIVDELLAMFQYRGPAKRLWLQETNLPAIRKGLASLRDNREFRNLYTCALARSRADWIMGMNLTRGYTTAWQSKGNEGTLHIGRVQTPTLCQIVARDLEIEGFQPKDFFVLKIDAAHGNGTFMATWQPPKDAPFLDDGGRILDKAEADKVAAKVRGNDAMITYYETTPKLQHPPLPFSLNDLQKACNRILGLSPSQTLAVAQALYEKHKLTSYPRTDYSHLPDDEHGLGEKIIDAARSNFGDAWPFTGQPDFTLRSPAWNSTKIGDHHGIRPTTVKGYDLKQLSKTELAVYRLIVRNFLAQFFPPYRYDTTAVELFCEGESFKATGTVETAAGWKVLFRTEGADANDDKGDEAQALPKMAADDVCKVAKASVSAEKTKPPPRFNGATIIDAMQNAYRFVEDPKVKAKLRDTGIGTPATRAAIVDNLVDRGYVDEVKEGKGKVYISSARGRLLYQAVPPQLRKPDITAYFEELLKAIERGELDLETFMAHQVKYIGKLVADIQSGKVASEMPRLEDCAPPARKAPGATRKGGSRTPARAATAPQTPPQGHQGESRTCPRCQAPMRLRTASNGPFWGCTAYPECKQTLPAETESRAQGRAPARAPSPESEDSDFPI